MTDRELMQQALDALNRSDYLGWQVNIPIIKALRERLAQPEQKPFCYHDGRNIVGKEYADHSDVFPLYTAQPQRKPLTDDEIDALMPVADGSAETDVVPVEVSPGLWGKEYSEVDAWSRPLVFQIARAIEAKLKEKNG